MLWENQRIKKKDIHGSGETNLCKHVFIDIQCFICTPTCPCDGKIVKIYWRGASKERISLAPQGQDFNDLKCKSDGDKMMGGRCKASVSMYAALTNCCFLHNELWWDSSLPVYYQIRPGISGWT